MDCRLYRAAGASAAVLVPELARRERRPRVSAARAKCVEALPGDWLPSTAYRQSIRGSPTEPSTAMCTGHPPVFPRLAPVDILRERVEFFTGNPAVSPNLSTGRERSQTDQAFAPRYGVRPVPGGRRFALSAVPFRTEIRGVASTASQQSMQGLRTDRPQGYPQHCAQNARRVGPMICTENPPPSPRRLQPVFHNPSPDLSTGWPAAPLRSINPMRARD